MAAVGGDNFMRYIYRGEEGEIIPREATHIIILEGVTFVRAGAFAHHRNIVEVICHDKVEKIEERAFRNCPKLKRVIIKGVKIVERWAFNTCAALTDVECGRLEIIGQAAFGCCGSLRSINLPSARIVGEWAFNYCETLVDATFGSTLERFVEGGAFVKCTSLERVTIPMKDGLFTTDDMFQGCERLKHVDLVEGELHETIASLYLEEWRNDMHEEIDSINRILPDTCAGYYEDEDDEDDGEDAGVKALAIRRWIRSVLRKIVRYQAEHQNLLNVAETTLILTLALPHDIVNRSVLPFLELPSHTFELAEGGDEDEDEDSYSEGSSSEGEESELEEEVNDDDEASSKRRRIEIE